jgi:hypothetical protein
LEEVFDFIYDPEQDVQVQAVTLAKLEGRARLMILIQGKPNTAQHIMANLMTNVQDLHDRAEQREAMPPEDESKIVGTDGEVLSDQPQLEIVS